MSSCWGPDVASPPLSPPCMCVATLASCRWHTDAQLEGRVCALSQQWGQPCTGVGTCLCRAVGAPQLLWGSWGPGVWCLTLKQPGRPGVAKGVGPGPSSGRGWAGSREGLWLGWRWGTWGPVERPEKSACGGEAAELPCRVVPSPALARGSNSTHGGGGYHRQTEVVFLPCTAFSVGLVRGVAETSQVDSRSLLARC